MFNRYLYQKLESQVVQKNKSASLQKKFVQKRKSKMQIEVNKYKSKVRNFLVELASHPIQLGQYQPPIKIIQRTIDTDHRLGAPQMFINGFKTNKQRLKQAQQQNKILDYSPMRMSLKNQSFRQRSPDKQIQPQMRFIQNKSLTLNKSHSNLNDGKRSKISQSQSNLKLPSILQNPEKKTYFKAIQEMGNSLKMMEQSQNQRIGLQNRLMIVMDGKQAHIEQTAMDLLVRCKLLKKRVNSQRTFKSLKTVTSSNL